MTVEVGKIRGPIAKAIGCSTCALGIALDIVGKRWGDEGFDGWACDRSDCGPSSKGLTVDQIAAVKAIGDELAGQQVEIRTGEATPDPRLPPERDDDEVIQ